MLVEGSFMRAIERVLGISINTVKKLQLDAGRACLEYHDSNVWGLSLRHVEVDELHTFCYAKEKNVPTATGVIDAAGELWTFTAVDRDSKLLITWLCGRREATCAEEFAYDLAARLSSRVQISSDGATMYHRAFMAAFGHGVDYATTTRGVKRRLIGSPDLSAVGTSYVERHNLTIRASMRRYTRRTNAFSKKFENHVLSFALFATCYNWIRPHMSLSTTYPTTPAMASGLALSPYTMEWLADLVEDYRERQRAIRGLSTITP